MVREEVTPLGGSSKSRTGAEDDPGAKGDGSPGDTCTDVVQPCRHQTQQAELGNRAHRKPHGVMSHVQGPSRELSREQKQPEGGLETAFLTWPRSIQKPEQEAHLQPSQKKSGVGMGLNRSEGPWAGVWVGPW